MAATVAPAPARAHVRPLFDVSRQSARHEAELLPLIPQEFAWDVLSVICNQQLSQDALLLWRYDLRHERVHLLAATPATPWMPEFAVSASDPLAQLGTRRLEALAHVQCALSACPLEQTLSDLGLHAGLTAVIADSPTEACLVTFGYRERWQLVSHHTSAVVAMAEYLREVQRLVLPQQTRWWKMVSLVPHLWRQPYRPSILRTIYDLNEMLSDMVDRTRQERPADSARVRGQVARLAHRGAGLVARLESAYRDPRALVTAEEFLSEAVLLVRGAYQLCLGDWPGCMAAAGVCPSTHEKSPNLIRHELVDWVLGQMESQD